MIAPLRIVFAGTPEFALPSLRAAARHGQVVAVYTQPDRPAGRGLKLTPSAVSIVAGVHGLSLDKPAGLKSEEAQRPLLESHPDVLVVAAYGLLLPKAVLDIPIRGCLNIHASLLPRWRGAAPIQRAIEAGDAETGISIMRMEAGLDSGPVYLRKPISIAPTDTTRTLHDKLAALGGEAICEVLRLLERDDPQPVPQPEAGVTYAKKISKSEASLDWRRSAAELARQVRAFDPFPIATIAVRGETIRVWQASALSSEATDSLRDGSAALGEVVQVDDDGIAVRCAGGVLRLEALQRPGGKRVAAADFLRGMPVRPGERLAADA